MTKLQKVIALSLILACLLSLTVHANTSWVTPDVIGNPNAEHTLTIWLHREFGPRAAVPASRELLIERMESWARKNPNVKVVIDMDMGSDKTHEYMTKLFEAARAGNAPDIASLDSFYLGKFFEAENELKQKPQPIDQYMTQKELDNYFDAYREFCTAPDGTLRAHFYYTDARVLWYRKDLVETPPTTWDELIEMAKQLKAADPSIKEGFLTYGGRWENTTFNFWGPYWASGGKLVDDSGRPIFNEGENREKMLDIMRLLKRLVDEGIMPTSVVSLASTADLNAAIANSNPPFVLAGSWHSGSLPLVIGEEKFRNWDIALPPSLHGEEQVTGAGGWVKAIFTDDPIKRDLAFSFIWHVYGDLKGMAMATVNSLPTFKDVVSDYAPLKNQPFLYKASTMLSNSRLRPTAAIYPEISRALQIAFGEVIIGSKTPEQALDDAWKNVMDLYVE